MRPLAKSSKRQHYEEEGGTSSGARAALSGYRRQALYTARLLLREAGESRVFQPEGKEDLAIFDGDKLKRIVQVKAYSAPLTLSDLDPGKPNSFFRRVLALEDHEVDVEVASFGPLGPELLRVQQRDRETLASVTDKLCNHGYAAAEAGALLGRLVVTCVDEPRTKNEVLAFLSKTVTAGDPDRAFDLMTWWLLDAAEKRLRITPQQFRDRLKAIGKYVAEREAHHQEWFKTIRPLEDQADPRRVDATTLEQEYYQGAAARYSHILADLDVRRGGLLGAIETEFQHGKKVVILHGASGQGKTSLALRYLHDCVPDGWRFLVTAIDSRRHAATIANAFADHLHALALPLYILIDVAPRDLDWVALVQELLDFQQVRILVTIREEDLARQTSAPHALGFPSDIRLEFTSPEARPIYNTLVQREEALNAFPTFEEAWERFGGEGPLLEFVYLLTQTASLRSVLTAQVQRLREEVRSGSLQARSLRLLQLCAVATAYEAKVLLRPLADHLELPDPAGTVGLFEREYLLRIAPDGSTVESLHPFRSALLADVLTDPAFARAEEIVLEILPFIPEEDLEVYLLHVLSRQPESCEAVRAYLAEYRPKDWSIAAGLARVLIWWSLRTYLDQNREVLAEYSSLPGGSDGLILILPDLTGACDSNPLESLHELLESHNPAVGQQLRALRDRLTPTDHAFEALQTWIGGLRVETMPESVREWEGLAEIMFWAGHLGVPSPSSLRLNETPMEALPIEVVGKICLGLASTDPEAYETALSAQEERLKLHFRQETSSPLVTEQDGDITAHFIVPSEHLLTKSSAGGKDAVGPRSPDFESRERSQHQRELPTGERDLSKHLNDEAVGRASLLRALFPNRSSFCTQGYGHELGIEGLEFPYDGTHKEMPSSSLLVPWLTRANGITNSLWLYQTRPGSWRQYAEAVLQSRETVATALLKLKRSLSAYFQGSRPRSLLSGTLPEQTWQEATAAANSLPRLPKSAVDEWGLSSETQERGDAENARVSTTVASVASLLSQRPLSAALRDYFSALGYFFNQGALVCATHGFFGRQPHAREELRAIAEEAGYDEHQVRLTKLNLFNAMQQLREMQEAFDQRARYLVDATKLDQVKRRETELFPELWALWYQFCDHPEKRFLSAGTQAVSEFEAARTALLDGVRRAISTEEGWRVLVLDEAYSWEGESALAFQLDINAIALLEEAREGFLIALEQEFGGREVASLSAYVLKYFWSYVLIVPTIGSRVLGGGTWVLPSTSFAGLSEESLVDRGWLKLLHPLGPEETQALGLEMAESNRFGGLDALQETSVQLQLSFSHLLSFWGLAPHLDDQGKQILADYFSKLSPRLNELLASFQSLVPKVCHSIKMSSLIDADLRDEAVSILESAALGLEQFSGEGRAMGFADYERWAKEFQELSTSLTVLSWLAVEG